ncbi:MAG: ISL3 family transposase [Geodermatophilaceae bacterium]|nr:ISL3 family transposase [Geodermatophilaceae bacterium]
MSEATSLLYDLPGFVVVSCQEATPEERRVVVMQAADEHACPRCGVLVGPKPYDVRESRIKDLPLGHRPPQVVWRKRRYRCGEARCARRVFTERSVQVPPRHRLTGRLRERLERAASGSARALADVAGEYGVSWWSVQRSLVVKAAALAARSASMTAPGPVRMLGLDETRARSLRWAFDQADQRWRLSNPWMTSFVDLDLGRPGWLLGLMPGRSGATVEAWLRARDQAWRDGIEVVALDPSAPFAAAVRRLLPQATIVVDHWHLVRLANQMVTEVRQRVAREQLGRRGRKADPAWAHRRLLLAAGDRLSSGGLDRLEHVLAHDDPTDEIGAAWGVKERLRQLLAETDPDRIRHKLWLFYDAAAAADMPETTRLAETIQTWWPQVAAFLRVRVTNARTEGGNRVIKQIKRVGCGYRNQANYERRIILHVAAKNAA